MKIWKPITSVKAYKGKKWAEVFLEDKDIDDQLLIDAMRPLADKYQVIGID